MSTLAFFLCLAVVAVVAVLLFKKYNPQGVLLIAGILMVALGAILGISAVEVAKPTGSVVYRRLCGFHEQD